MRSWVRIGIVLLVAALLSTGCGNSQPTWTVRPVPSGVDNLFDVDCPTTAQCYAVGQEGNGSGAVIGSSDGGVQWHVLMTTPQTQFYAVDCPDANTCIVGRGTSPSNNPQPQVFLTRDSGAFWSPEAVPPQMGFIGGATCPSLNVCLVIGLGVARTTDGGSNWVVENTPGRFATITSIFCRWAGSSCIIGGGSAGGDALDTVSHDSGASWSRPAVVSGPTNTEGSRVASSLGPISCSEAGHCIGLIETDAADLFGSGSLVFTSDRGSTWSRGSTSVGWTFDCAQSFCLSVGFHLRSATIRGDAFASNDGGTDWSPARVPTRVALSAASCPSSNHCVVVGGPVPDAKSGVIMTSS